jgi:signal peptidase I
MWVGRSPTEGGGAPAPGSRSAAREVWDTVRAIVIAVVVALLLRTFVVETFQVQGFSMEPTLQNGDRLLVNKVVLHFSPPHIGEIIVFLPPLPAAPALVAAGIAEASCEYVPSPPVDFVKRVIAVGGETVYLRNGQVYVDGRLQPEPFLPPAWRDHYTSPVPVRVPVGDVYVLGDHRAASEDSRCFGPVPDSRIVGVAQLIWWPLGQARVL